MTSARPVAALAASHSVAVSQRSDQPSTFWYFLVAEPDPGLLPRVLGQFAKRSLVPDHLHCSRGPDGLHLDIRTAGVDGATAQILAAALRQIVGVRSMLSTEGTAPPLS